MIHLTVEFVTESYDLLFHGNVDESKRCVPPLFNERAAYIFHDIPRYQLGQFRIAGGEGESGEKLELLQRSLREGDPAEDASHPILRLLTQTCQDLRQ